MPPQPLVLIVDDEDICQTIVSAMVKKIGLPTLSARDGLEAVELFTRHRQNIICVLMDLQMPHMNGVDACRRIREMDQDMPVIFASGFIDSDNRERLDPFHPLGYLKKPVGYGELSELLSRVIAAPPLQGEMTGIPGSACPHNPGRGCD